MSKEICEAAKRHNWEGCKEALVNRLMHIGQYEAAGICLTYFNLYMPRFLDKTEDSDWLSIRLKDIQESKLFSETGSDLSSFPDMELEYYDPKLRGVKWAVFYFWTAARFHADGRIRASNLTEAISNMINLIRLEHPAWFPAQYDVKDIRTLDSDEYWEFMWTKLAVRLELE